MTEAALAAIIEDRLGPRWRRLLLADHATPLVLVGVGHAHSAGRVCVYTVDEPDMTDIVIAAFLRKAAIMLDPNQRREIP